MIIISSTTISRKQTTITIHQIIKGDKNISPSFFINAICKIGNIIDIPVQQEYGVKVIENFGLKEYV